MSEQQPDTSGSRNGSGSLQGVLSELPTDQLKQEFEDFLKALAQRAVTMVASQDGGAVAKAVSGAVGGGPSAMRGLLSGGLSAVTGAVTKSLGGGGKGRGGSSGSSSGQKFKVTNIVEDIEVGLPRTVAYNLWTQFEDFPSFMKKVESVNQEAEEELSWSAQILWSHRTWRSTIVEQVPDERIIWQSEADKGYVDGAVTFHATTPDDTRILVVLEYHPRGFFEGTGNLWRAQGRRVRLELKHFRRHAMTQALLHPDEITGWRGEIRDGEVVRGDEDGNRPEDDDRADKPGSEDEDDYADADDQTRDEYDEDRDEYDEEDEDHGRDDESRDEYEDEYDDRDEDDYGADEDGEEEPEDEGTAPRRARSRAGARGR
jgi:uncharacterized membrane protein